jgi:hypothetical protein
MSRFPLRILGISCVMCVCAACGPGASTSADNRNTGAQPPGVAGEGTEDTSGWVKNGATACDKYLTPDLIGAVFTESRGQSHAQDGQTCIFEQAHQPNHDYSTITIYLRDGGNLVFDGDPTTRNGTVIPGVGDKAVRTQEDGVQAVKGDHICSVFVKPPYGNRLNGDALAQKLGEVCTRLFALP